jgi:DNA-binding MarR family transcriptional regulator
MTTMAYPSHNAVSFATEYLRANGTSHQTVKKALELCLMMDRLAARDAELTKLQRQVLSMVREEIEMEGASPTYDEMAKALMVGKSSIAHAVERLIDLGLVGKRAGRSRSLYLI